MTGLRNVARTLAALAFACAALPVLADPARACSCATLQMEPELARGSAVGIVTRTDDGANTSATFRVERSFGVDLPPTLTGFTSNGLNCAPTVSVDEVAALVFYREGGWQLPTCSRFELGDVLTRADGPPRVTSAEPPVVLAAGDYGGSGLATLDRFGRVVALSRNPHAP